MKSKKRLVEFGRSQRDPQDEFLEDVESQTSKKWIQKFLVFQLMI